MSEKINENGVQWCWASLGKTVLSVVLLMPLITMAETWTDKDYNTWEYTVSGGKATITKYKNYPSGIVSIPEKINGIPVVKVGDYAYSNKKSFTGLIIPDCITEIGLSAFENCTALADVVIGSHLTNVTETSFWGCTAIRSVTFKSVPSIKKANVVTGDWILESTDETYRNEVYLCPRVGPYGKAKLQWQILVKGNSAHERLEWKWSDNANRYARIGWYVDGVKTTSILCTGSDGWNYYDVSIPNGAHLVSCEYSMEGNETGGNDARVRVSLVKEKLLDKTVKSIFPDAYEHIERVSLGSGLNTPSGFFNDCTSLTRVDAESIGEWLGHSFSVESSSPLQNGAKLYVDGKLLTNLVIPDGMTRIGAYAFLNCTSITNVVFPRSVVSIYTSAFKGCENVRSTTIRSDGFQLDLVFPAAYRKLESIVIQEGSEYIGSKFAYGCEALKRLEVKDELASIGSSAFYGCSSLASITIPPKIKSVGAGAFGNCPTLTRVDIESLSTWLEIDFEDFEANPLSAGGDLIVSGDKVTSITFPQGVAEVRRNVFSGCSSLSNVVFSADVSTVLGSAFAGCGNVKNVGFRALPRVPTIKNVSGNWIAAPEQIDGSVVYRSPAIGNSTETSMQATLTGPQNYSFRWAVSSEDQYDFLIWSLDGKEMGRISGNKKSLESVLCQISKGEHVVSWTYKKDSYEKGGSDCGWVELQPLPEMATLKSLFPDSCAGISRVMIHDIPELPNSFFSGCEEPIEIVFSSLDAPKVNAMEFMAMPKNSLALVKRDSKGWAVDIPGVWKGINIDYATYDVRLDAEGGIVIVSTVVVDMGDPYGELPIPTRKGYAFDGWYTAREGGVKVLASDIPTEDTTLYAHWTIITYAITYSELHLAANPNPIQYTVEDSVCFDALGNLPGRKFVGWSPANIPLGSVGDVNVTALWQDVGVEDELGETASTGGDANWFVAWDGGNAMLQSGAVVKKQSSWLEMSFEDAARVSFEWKASCEGLGGESERTDGMVVEIDGVEVGFICGETGWIAATNLVAGEGTHKIRWTYAKDGKTDLGEDCAWVRNVVVTPLRFAFFDAGGAETGVAPESISTYVGEQYVLPDNGSLKKAKHSFAGWKFGEDVFAAGAQCVMPPSDVTYKAIWNAKVLDAPCITAPVTYDEESTLVSISAAEETTVYYTLDGSVPSANNGTRYVGAFRVTGTAKVSAVAVLDDWYDSVVAQVVTTRSWTTLEDSLGVDDEEFTITTGGSANWIGDRANACVKSTGDGWLNAAFVGPCVVAWEERTGIGDWSAKRQVFVEEGAEEIIWEGASLSVRGLQRLAVFRVDFASGEGTSGEAPQGTSPAPIYDAAGFSFELPSAEGLTLPKHRLVGWKLGETFFAVGSQCVMPAYDITYVGVWGRKNCPLLLLRLRLGTVRRKLHFRSVSKRGQMSITPWMVPILLRSMACSIRASLRLKDR